MERAARNRRELSPKPSSARAEQLHNSTLAELELLLCPTAGSAGAIYRASAPPTVTHINVPAGHLNLSVDRQAQAIACKALVNAGKMPAYPGKKRVSELALTVITTHTELTVGNSQRSQGWRSLHYSTRSTVNEPPLPASSNLKFNLPSISSPV